jgi:DNA-binding LacI/PurR family transcriptional regulator
VAQREYLRVLGCRGPGEQRQPGQSLGQDLVQQSSNHGTPIIERHISWPRLLTGFSTRTGARKAVEHLLAIGRRRIAHVTSPEHHHSAVVRAAATIDRLAEAGLDLVGTPMFGEWSEAWGRHATKILLGTAEFDAMFCGSDQIAAALPTRCGRRAAAACRMTSPSSASTTGT